ncbi:MAG: leucine-rich repeat domain-containing protein [bacterium]
MRNLDGNNFYSIVNSVMFNCKNLAWIDLSHNYLTSINYAFTDFPNLKTLYLHANYIS